MKIIITLSLVLVISSVVQCTSYERYFRDETHPGKCVVNGQIVNPGESIKHPTMECAEFTCDNSIGLATIETCDPISALPSPLQTLKNYDQTNPPKCTWGDFKNTKAAYPKCCERYYTCIF